MKIVKKENGNIEFQSNSGEIDFMIQPTGVVIKNEQHKIKISQVGYSDRYITTSEVIALQLLPDPEIPFDGASVGATALLMNLLSTYFFVLPVAVTPPTPTPEWTEVEITITATATSYSDGRPPLANGLNTVGSVPIEILPAAGAGKYYDYEGNAEYDFDSIALTFAGADAIGIISDYSGGAGEYTGNFFNSDSFTRDGAFEFSSKSPYISKSLISNILVSGPAKLGEPLTMTTWNGTDPDTNDGTLKIKLKYKEVTFG